MNTHNAVKQSRLTAIYKSFYQQMQSKCNCKECEKKMPIMHDLKLCSTLSSSEPSKTNSYKNYNKITDNINVRFYLAVYKVDLGEESKEILCIQGITSCTGLMTGFNSWYLWWSLHDRIGCGRSFQLRCWWSWLSNTTTITTSHHQWWQVLTAADISMQRPRKKYP